MANKGDFARRRYRETAHIRLRRIFRFFQHSFRREFCEFVVEAVRVQRQRGTVLGPAMLDNVAVQTSSGEVARSFTSDGKQHQVVRLRPVDSRADVTDGFSARRKMQLTKWSVG